MRKQSRPGGALRSELRTAVRVVDEVLPKKEGERDREPGTRSLLPRIARSPGRQSISECFFT